MMNVQNMINEATRHADVILPGLSALEQAHHDDLIWQFAVGSGAKYSAPVLPPADGRPQRGAATTVGRSLSAWPASGSGSPRAKSTSAPSPTGSSTCSPTCTDSTARP